jgi:hypothetical protein
MQLHVQHKASFSIYGSGTPALAWIRNAGPITLPIIRRVIRGMIRGEERRVTYL